MAHSWLAFRPANTSPPAATTAASRDARFGSSASSKTGRLGGRASKPSAAHTKNVGAGSSSTASKLPTTAVVARIRMRARLSVPSVVSGARRHRRHAPMASALATPASATVASAPRSASDAIQSLLGHGFVGMKSFGSNAGSPRVVKVG